MPKMRYFN